MELTYTLKWCVVMILVGHIVISSGKVSDRTCSVNGGECGSIRNAHCCECCSICMCDADYDENPHDGISCELVVSAKNCTSGGTECDVIDNAECNSTTMKCKCIEGFVEKANTCVEHVSAASTNHLNGIGILRFAVITIVTQWLFHMI